LTGPVGLQFTQGTEAGIVTEVRYINVIIPCSLKDNLSFQGVNRLPIDSYVGHIYSLIKVYDCVYKCDG
jgi:hypothetical protein